MGQRSSEQDIRKLERSGYTEAENNVLKSPHDCFTTVLESENNVTMTPHDYFTTVLESEKNVI